MSTVLVFKNDQGKIEGFGQRGAKRYAKFLKAVKSMEVGELLSFTFRVPRSPKFHKYHFAVLKTVFDSQDQFADPEQFRKWAEVGAGHCDFVPGPKGKMVALPRSIAYEALDDAEFSDVHKAVKAFLRSTHATRFLWPNLDDAEGMEMISTLIEEFERRTKQK